MEAERKGPRKYSWEGLGGGTTDLDFTEIKLFLDMRKEEIKCLIDEALETRLNSSKIQQK